MEVVYFSETQPSKLLEVAQELPGFLQIKYFEE
jgi:hypothetical protein